MPRPWNAQPSASPDARMRAFVHQLGEWGAYRWRRTEAGTPTALPGVVYLAVSPGPYAPYRNMTGSGCHP